MLLTAAALYLARTRRPILGGLCGAGAAFTRSLGLLLFVPLLWELVHDAVQRRRRTPGKSSARCSCRSASRRIAISTGVWRETRFSFSSTSASTGTSARDCFSAPPHIRRTICCAACAAAAGATRSVSGWPNLIACFAALGLLVAAAPKLRASQTAWFLAYYIVAVGATWLLSAPRYLLVLLPVPLALAQCAQKRTAGRILTALSVLASFGYLIAFALRWQVW